MKKLSTSALEHYIYDVLFEEHIPDQEFKNRTDEVLFKDTLFDAISDLRKQGKIKSYKKDKVIYHYSSI